MKKKLMLCLCFVVLLLGGSVYAWDSAQDFSTTNGNPNGQWTYGTKPSGDLYGSLTAFDTVGAYQNTVYWCTSAGSQSTCAYNPVSGEIYPEYWGVNYFMPSNTTMLGQYNTSYGMPVYRWTAPVDGDYAISANFWGAVWNGSGTSSIVYVVNNNSTTLFSGTISGFVGSDEASAFGTNPTAMYSGIVSLQAGNTIDFIANHASTSVTGVDITINVLNTSSPLPANGGQGLTFGEFPILTWQAGVSASSEQIYIGTSFADVNTATTATTEVYQGTQLVNPSERSSFAYTGSFEIGKTYYWRVDDVNGVNTWKGNVWSFTVDAVSGSWNAANEFSATNNPSGVWEYGVINGQFSTGFLKDTFTQGYYVDMWTIPTDYTQANTARGFIFHNSSAVTLNLAGTLWGDSSISPANQLALQGSYYSVSDMHTLRFTSPATGTYQVDVLFKGLSYSGTGTLASVYVAKNGDYVTPLFTGAINGFIGTTEFGGIAALGNLADRTASYSAVLTLAAGDVVDIYRNGGANSSNSVGIDVTVLPQMLIASDPTPTNGNAMVDNSNVTLTWGAGANAAASNGHYVYFGTDSNSVRDATSMVGLGVYMGRQTAVSYLVGALLPNTTYYWRIDEADGSTIWKGQVWSFKTAPDRYEWNCAEDYSTENGNPNGQWTYGKKTAGSLSGSLITFSQVGYYMGTVYWYPTAGSGVECAHNPTDSELLPEYWGIYYAMLPKATVMAQISSDYGMPVYRWTALKAGDYLISADFSGVTTTGTNSTVYVVKDGTTLFTGTINGFVGNDDIAAFGTNQTASYSGIVTLAADSTIDFIANHSSVGATGINAAIRLEPARAANPVPANYATDVNTNQTLNWEPGIYAVSHDVYIGDSLANVTDATRTSPLGVYKGNQTSGTYKPGFLTIGKTYYWRVDEVNSVSNITKGDIWQFTPMVAKGDINNDGKVDFKDVTIMAGEWLSTTIGHVWENDMSANPVGNGWVDRQTSSYTMSSGLMILAEAAWGTVIDSTPDNDFIGVTTIDLDWRATTVTSGDPFTGLGLWINVNHDTDTYGNIHFETYLTSASGTGTQSIDIYSNNTVIETVTGFTGAMLHMHSVIDGKGHTIAYSINDGITTKSGNVGFTDAAGSGQPKVATLFTAAPGGEIDYLKIQSSKVLQSDLNGDDVVNFVDFAELADAWLANSL